MIPWPPRHGNDTSVYDTDWISDTASSNTIYRVPVKPAASSEPEETRDERRARIHAEARTKQRKLLTIKQNKQNARGRSGTGHDPRHQVVCRSRVQSRGRGQR